MRLLKFNLLAVAALLFFAANASAYQITMTTTYDGSEVAASDYIEVKVWLDTQGESNIGLMEVGVIFDQATLSYERSLSSTGGGPSIPGYPNYILYGTASVAGSVQGTYMEPRVPIPSGFTWDPPILIVPGQVNLAWVEVGGGSTSATATNALLATLIFHVIPGAVDGGLTLTLSEGGTVFALGDLSIINDQVILGPGINVNVPEPSTALLIGLGIIGLGVAGRRR